MTDISFLIVEHERLSNEPKDWNSISLFVSSDSFISCRKITIYSDLFYTEEYEEFKKRMNCNIISEKEFNNRYWKDDFSTKRRGTYKKISKLPKRTREAIETCKQCVDKWCYRGCKTHEYLENRRNI